MSVPNAPPLFERLLRVTRSPHQVVPKRNELLIICGSFVVAELKECSSKFRKISFRNRIKIRDFISRISLRDILAIEARVVAEVSDLACSGGFDFSALD
jgi:hypothetical protein